VFLITARAGLVNLEFTPPPSPNKKPGHSFEKTTLKHTCTKTIVILKGETLANKANNFGAYLQEIKMRIFLQISVGSWRLINDQCLFR
jgi:hypothetical protein